MAEKGEAHIFHENRILLQ